MISYNEFKEYIRENFMRFVPDDIAREYHVIINEVLKVNRVEEHFSLCRNNGNTFAPSISLNESYKDFFSRSYRANTSVNEYVATLAKRYIEYLGSKSLTSNIHLEPQTQNFNVTNILSDLDSHVRLIVINTRINERLLSTVPHRTLNNTDLSIIYAYAFDKDNNSGIQASVIIDNIIIKRIPRFVGLSYEQVEALLYNNAYKNSRKCANIRSLSSLFSMGDICDGTVVISTTDTNYGAATIAITELLDDIFDGEDSIIIPSSLDECIAVPARLVDLTGDISDVGDMISTVNATLEFKTILSYSAYRYSPKNHTLTMAYNGSENLEKRISEDPELLLFRGGLNAARG